MLITITTGNQVLIYEAESNPSVEEWKIVKFQICDIIIYLVLIPIINY